MEKKRRNLITEIQEVKSRTEFNSRFDYLSRLRDIERALEEFTSYNGDYNLELLKYIPIATVACFEAFFRSTVKELVDFGKPFSDNVSKFNQAKNVKPDFDVIAAIQTKSLTVGEFVGHMLPYNNLADIVSNISILIDRDFLEELKAFKQPGDNFTSQVAKILQGVEDTYKLRHIFCHEFAVNIKIDPEKIKSDYQHCKLFLEQSNDFIWDLLYPNAPQSQQDMNEQSADDFQNADNELAELIRLIKEISKEEDPMLDFDKALFDKCTETWKAYRDAHADYSASVVTGGSMYRLLHNSARKQTTLEKIRSLQDEFEILLRRNKVI